MLLKSQIYFDYIIQCSSKYTVRNVMWMKCKIYKIEREKERKCERKRVLFAIQYNILSVLNLQFIYQTFYNTSSAADKGTLYYLRNRVGRIDVQGPDEVVSKYRYCLLILLKIQCIHNFTCTCTSFNVTHSYNSMSVCMFELGVLI